MRFATPRFPNLLLPLTLLTAPVLANAEGRQPIELGVKGGIMFPDFPGFDSVINVGFFGSYPMLGKDSHFGRYVGGGTLHAEGDLTFTLLNNDAGAFGDWNVLTIGAYGAFTYPVNPSFYLKAKAGLVRTDIDVDLPGSGANGTDTDPAFGFGIGFPMNHGKLEVEFTLLDSDLSFLSAGWKMRF